MAADPLQLGVLRGKNKKRMFAGGKTREEREAVQRAVGTVCPSLERIGAAEARAEQVWGAGVDGLHAADTAGIPRLSATAVSGDIWHPSAGDAWPPSNWRLVPARSHRRLRSSRTKVGERLDGSSCRWWPAPLISPDTAAAAVGTQAAVKDDRARGEAWRAVQQDKQLAELTAASKAGEQASAAAA